MLSSAVGTNRQHLSLRNLGAGSLNVSIIDSKCPFVASTLPFVVPALRGLVPLLPAQAALVGEVFRVAMSRDLSCVALTGSFPGAIALCV